MIITLTPSWVLTSEHPSSRHGIPVLVNQTHRWTAYSASDMLDAPPSDGGLQAAAHLVCRFAPHLAGGELEVARCFCRQWPDGPQVRD